MLRHMKAYVVLTSTPTNELHKMFKLRSQLTISGRETIMIAKVNLKDKVNSLDSLFTYLRV